MECPQAPPVTDEEPIAARYPDAAPVSAGSKKEEPVPARSPMGAPIPTGSQLKEPGPASEVPPIPNRSQREESVQEPTEEKNEDPRK